VQAVLSARSSHLVEARARLDARTLHGVSPAIKAKIGAHRRVLGRKIGGEHFGLPSLAVLAYFAVTEALRRLGTRVDRSVPGDRD